MLIEVSDSDEPCDASLHALKMHVDASATNTCSLTSSRRFVISHVSAWSYVLEVHFPPNVRTVVMLMYAPCPPFGHPAGHED